MRSASTEGFFQSSKYSTSNLVWQPNSQIQCMPHEQGYNQPRLPYYEKQQIQNPRQNYRIVSNSINSKQELLQNNQNIYDNQLKHGVLFERNRSEKASFSTAANNDTVNIPTFELGQETSESLLQIVDQINTNETFQQDISKRVSVNCKFAIDQMEAIKMQLFLSQEIDQNKQQQKQEKVINTDQRSTSLISRDNEKPNQTPQYFRSRQNSATHYHQQAQSSQSVSALCQFPHNIQFAQRQQQLQPPNSQQIQDINQKQAYQSMANERQKSYSLNKITTNQTSLSSSFAQHSTRKSSCESNPVGSSVFNISAKTFYDPNTLMQKKLEKNKLSNYNYDNLLKEELPVFCVNCERYVQLSCLERHSSECLNPERSYVPQQSKEKNDNAEQIESFEKTNDDLIRIELQIMKRLEKAKNQQEQALKFALKISQTVREVYELEKIEQSLIQIKQQRAMLSIEFISELILYDRLILLFWQKMKALGFKQPNLIGIKQTLEPKKYLYCCLSDQKYNKESAESKSALKNSFQSYSDMNNRQQLIFNKCVSNFQAQTDFKAKFNSNVVRIPFADFASIRGGGGQQIQKQIMI